MHSDQRTTEYLQIEHAFMLQLYQVLSQQRWIETIQIVPQTKVPIIKIKTAAVPIPFMDQGYKPIVWIDITLERPTTVSLPKTRPIQTSEFVRRLVRGFPAIKPLALVLKQLLVERGLNESYTGGLCSYGLVLMITHVIRRDYEKKNARKREKELLNRRKGKKKTMGKGGKEESEGGGGGEGKEGKEGKEKVREPEDMTLQKEKGPENNKETAHAAHATHTAHTAHTAHAAQTMHTTHTTTHTTQTKEKMSKDINNDNSSPEHTSTTTTKEEENEEVREDGDNYCEDDEDSEEGRPPLGRLLLDFLEYYGVDFDANSEGISLERDSGTFPRSNAFCSGSLVVQDPLALTNNVTGGCYGWNALRNTFSVAAISMRESYSTLYDDVVRALQVNIGQTKESRETKESTESTNGAIKRPLPLPSRTASKLTKAFMGTEHGSTTPKNNDGNKLSSSVEQQHQEHGQKNIKVFPGISVLGRMFGTNHHSHVIDHASKLWCPSEIPPPVARKNSLDSMASSSSNSSSDGNAMNEDNGKAATTINRTINTTSNNKSYGLLSSLNASLSIENTYLREQVEKLLQQQQLAQNNNSGKEEGKAEE